VALAAARAAGGDQGNLEWAVPTPETQNRKP